MQEFLHMFSPSFKAPYKLILQALVDCSKKGHETVKEAPNDVL